MNKLLAFLLAVLSSAAPAAALEWQNIGPRALGMGGAGVAMPQGPLNAYWNPAGLGLRGNTSGGQVPIHIHAALTGDVIEGAKDLNEIAKNPAAYSAADVTRALGKVNQPGSGLRLDTAVAPAVKIKRVSVFTNTSVHMGAVPFADLTVTNPGALQATNNSKLVLKGIQLAEFGVGYGQELPFLPGLLVGGSVKLMKGQVGYFDYFVTRLDPQDNDLLRKFKDGAKTSASFGVDLGALWDMERTFEGVPMRPRLGLIGRNLNNPTFSQPAAAVAAGRMNKFAVNPQVRMGVAASLLNWWHVAADLDLTENLTTIEGLPSRQLSLGTEVNVFNRSWINIPLRAGILRNVADDSKTMLSLGFGLNILRVSTELSLAWSPKKVRTQSAGKSESIPAEVAGGVSLSVLFGGGKEGSEKTPKRAPVPPSEAQKSGEQAERTELFPAEAQKVREEAEKAQKSLDEESKKTP